MSLREFTKEKYQDYYAEERSPEMTKQSVDKPFDWGWLYIASPILLCFLICFGFYYGGRCIMFYSADPKSEEVFMAYEDVKAWKEKYGNEWHVCNNNRGIVTLRKSGRPSAWGPE